jgi:Ulp1 family protease
MAFLKKRDEKMCNEMPGKKPSMFYILEFIYFNKERQPQYKEMKRMRAKHKNIFDMEYIFIPIHRGNHYMCAVISMKEKKAKYYDSLV